PCRTPTRSMFIRQGATNKTRQLREPVPNNHWRGLRSIHHQSSVQVKVRLPHICRGLRMARHYKQVGA
ncbi:MAG: hypothetical protein ACK56F_09985, partial [bacterium]